MREAVDGCDILQYVAKVGQICNGLGAETRKEMLRDLFPC